MLEAAAGVELGRGQVEWGTQGLIGWTPASHKVGCSKDKKQGLSEGTPHGGGRVGRNNRTGTEDQEAKTVKGRTDKPDRETWKIIHVFSFG